MSRRAKKKIKWHGPKIDQYERRNEVLHSLGFQSYKDYLCSPLWRLIRARVFQQKGRLCLLCGSSATELHHHRYHRNDLIGKKTKFIDPICRECHEKIEFSSGRKNKLHEAKIAFQRIRSDRRQETLDRLAVEEWERKNRTAIWEGNF